MDQDMNIFWLLYISGVVIAGATELKAEVSTLTRLRGPWGRNLKRCGLRQGLFLDLEWEKGPGNKTTLFDYFVHSLVRLVGFSAFSWLGVAFNSFAQEKFKQRTRGNATPPVELNKLLYEDLSSTQAIRLFEQICPDLGIGDLRHVDGWTETIAEIRKLAGRDWTD